MGSAFAEPAIKMPDFQARILRETEKCVSCGICLPHCPTYQKTGSEADSPRGRIALMRGAVAGHIPINPRFRQHIDLCLGCRSCETACPNGVGYGHALLGARKLLEHARPLVSIGPLRKWLLRRVLPHRGLLGLLGKGLRLYQRQGIQRRVRKTGILEYLGWARLERYLPALPESQGKWEAYYPPQGAQRGEVALFLGCVAQVVDRSALQSTLGLLTRLGYGVRIPRRQTCCGALHYHSGDSEWGEKLALRNIQAFAGIPAVPIITVASGCAAHLRDYGNFAGPPGAALAARIQDAGGFLSQAAGWESLSIAPWDHRVGVHQACTQRKVLGTAEDVGALLQRILRCRPVPLAGAPGCCGAAGAYCLTQPEMSDSLLEDSIRGIRKAAVSTVVTSNIGCRLHLQRGLADAGLDVEILHPAELLSRQLASIP